MRREYLYTDAEYAEVWACGQCGKAIGIETVDRYLVADAVFCAVCHDEFMEEYGEYCRREATFLRRLVRFFRGIEEWIVNSRVPTRWFYRILRAGRPDNLPF